MYRFILLLCVCCVNLVVYGQLYTYQLFDRDQGLTTQSIRCIAQDKLGYLYVGTDGAGLVRYDGYKFQPLQDKSVHAPMHVSQICFIGNEIYFSTLYSGIIAYYNDAYHQIYEPNENSGEQRGIAAVNNRLAIFSQKRISLITTNGKVLFSYAKPNKTDFKYRQILNFPGGVVAFTNNGNYVITEKGITSCESFFNYIGLKGISFGSYKDGVLKLTSSQNKRTYIFSFERNGQIKLIDNIKLAKNFSVEDQNHAFFSNSEHVYFFEENTAILKFNNYQIKQLAPNYNFDFGEMRSLYEDRDGDLWLSSSQGLVKISQEPFTKMEFNPFYLSNELGNIHRSKSNVIFVSNYEGELFVGSYISNTSKIHKNVSVCDFTETQSEVIIATRAGLMKARDLEIIPFGDDPSMRGHIQSVYFDKELLWYARVGDGLYNFNSKTKQIKRFELKTEGIQPSHVYSIESGHHSSEFYLGTNEGIFSFNKKTGRLIFLRKFKNLGSYAGNSIKDSYGTIWFTLDKGLAGITSTGEFIEINDVGVLQSILSYSLNSDDYGHLFVGSNLGINKIKVNAQGKVLNHQLYNKSNGFNGYETNMRSSFQHNNRIYVGTIDGLYEINANLLMNLPIPQAPIVFMGRLSQNGNIINDDKNRFLSFRTINPRYKGIMYSWRIIGVDTNWSVPSSNPELLLPTLENGVYDVQVRATYDHINYSEITNFPLHINSPFWQSKWFIVIIIVLLGFGNIGYIEWTSSGLNSSVGNFNHEAIDARYLPKLLLFGLVINALVGLIDHDLLNLSFSIPNLNYTISSLLLIGYIGTKLLVKRPDGGIYLKYVFYVSVGLVAGQYYYMIYLSHVHPYPVIAILLLSTIIPYTFNKLRTIIIISVFQVCISILILIAVENTVYNEYLYITAVVISAALTILITYLRNDSLEKLIFVSNILNKGEIIVVAFDQNGLINYASKNLSDYFNVDTGLLIGKPLATLNPLVVTQEMRELSLVDEFADGKTFLVPMYNKESTVVWIEFSCKQFSNDVKVIVGQDITEKLTISANYQSLVENAQDMIYNTDISGNFIYLNEISSRTFGFRNENLIGQNSINVIHPDYRQTVQSFYENQFLNRIKNTYLEFPIRTKEGRIIWLGQNVTMTFEPGSRKRVSGFIALARDITEKRANELLIDQQNKDITASINSAKRIQFNLLPKPGVLKNYFNDFFVIYKPKDIVSGDFYWFHERNGKCFVVLADCTGHGVAGAFMTIVGMNLLNKLIIERTMDDPAEILNILHDDLNEMLHFEQHGDIPEGMEALICVFENDTLTFASSGVSLLHTTQDQIQQYKSSRNELNRDIYDAISVKLAPDSGVYLITDGYQKQFGSIRNKKFSFRRIKELLEKISVESMPLQKKYFENSWSNWSEGHEQTDDITVIGLHGFKNLSSPNNEPESTT